MTTTPPALAQVAVTERLDAAQFAQVEDLAVDLVEALVQIASPTGDTARAAAAFVRWGESHRLHAGLTPTGAPWISTARDPFAAGVARPHVLAYGHLDTVPGHVPVRVETTPEGPVLWGRGSVDAKGPLAVAAAAVAVLHAGGPVAGTLTVIGAPDEEGDSDSAFWCLGAFADHPPDVLLIGEPSGALACTIGYKGRVLLDVAVRRPVVHGGFPEPSATDHLVALLGRFRAAIGAEPDLAGATEGLFDRCTMKIRSLGVDNDGLVEAARARLDVRIPPGVSPRDVVARLMSDEVRPDVVVVDAIDAHVAPRATGLVRALCAAIREEGSRPVLLRKTGTSDLNLLAPAWPRAEAAAYGPGDSHLDHTGEERILLADVRRGARIVMRALAARLANHAPTNAI